jgi:hypothetical protein
MSNIVKRFTGRFHLNCRPRPIGKSAKEEFIMTVTGIAAFYPAGGVA